MAQAARGLTEGAIGHEQRAGGIIGEAEQEELVGDRIAKLRIRDDGGHLRAQLELHELVGELEGAAGRGEGGVDGERVPARIIAAHQSRVAFAQLTGAAMPIGERGDEAGAGAGSLQRKLGAQILGGDIEAMDVIAGFVEPVAHGLPRRASGRGGLAGQRFLHHGEALLRLPQGVVQLDITRGEIGILQVQPLCAGRIGRRRAKAGIGERPVEGAEQLLLGALVKRGPVERESAGQRGLDLGGERPVVIFKLGEIGDGDAEQARHSGLIHARIAAQLADLLADEKASTAGHRLVCSCSVPRRLGPGALPRGFLGGAGPRPSPGYGRRINPQNATSQLRKFARWPCVTKR